MRSFAPLLVALLAVAGTSLQAEVVVATRTLRAQTILTPDDLDIASMDVPGALVDPIDAVGLETRVAIYAGRPIRPEHLSQPAIVERNQTVSLAYNRGSLTIITEGRALERAAIGDSIRVMNVSSRTTVTATISADGTAYVNKD
ncbi:flagellar basal body P-ring formation chaperone FlgA [Thioclava sp. GXIMD4216]|uniref:Flagella basal body P-ring formation protein FlgA n=1 Tax=Thioclava litoralis TaxID=3076557 RepID=A0ABZ1DVV7_9RHOB|nr:flagellar basal body P-ring formation chaperone FlgA [Thioclava sp. FTW29]